MLRPSLHNKGPESKARIASFESSTNIIPKLAFGEALGKSGQGYVLALLIGQILDIWSPV